MLSKFKCVLAAATFVVASAGVNAASVSTIGNVSETDGVYTLSTGAGSVTDSALETFAGIAAGSLDAELGKDAIEGSAIQSTVEVEAGDTFTFDWTWESGEPAALGSDDVFDDFAFVALSLFGIEEVLATAAMDGAAASGSYSWTAGAAGVLTWTVGIVDVGDDIVNSYLNVSKLSPVPVPAAALLFGSALLGFAGFSARRKIS